MFLRFICAADRACDPLLTGPFLTLDRLGNQGRLGLHELEWAAEIEGWFDDHLPVPPFRARGFSKRALCWFFGGRNAALARMWDLVALLRHKDVAMQVVRTFYPGRILYVDDFQVVAELPRLRARRPLVARRRCV